MKKSLIIFAVVMVIAFGAAGIATSDAKAVVSGPPETPEEICIFIEDILSVVYGMQVDVGYDSENQRCYFIYQYNDMHNYCYPGYDYIEFKWGNYPIATDGIAADSNVGWIVSGSGCYDKNGSFIRDSNRGRANVGNGITFEYESQTCANGCHVSKYGLTGAAKKALGSLGGKVLGKAYIQVRDDDGNLVSGDFKLCFAAKGAKNPYFFRFGGGKSWAPIGGYWQGNQFCMSGNVSGNYVLVDR